MTQSSPHAWLRPKLAALVAEAEAAGIGRDVSVAVITDLINGPLSTAAPEQADEGWNQDIGEPESMVNGPAVTSPDQSAGATVPDPLAHVEYRGI